MTSQALPLPARGDPVIVRKVVRDGNAELRHAWREATVIQADERYRTLYVAYADGETETVSDRFWSRPATPPLEV
ncbi:hypothetical protein [uncultured Alsobacter sp.]|uniref:hypothetical protein n=1 Tax=uncultured Alsobacter sp. TaxID=1748258 RepID=UPI0025EC6F22|nr:hypothetical protein [uncultured Alsobacter sp.]